MAGPGLKMYLNSYGWVVRGFWGPGFEVWLLFILFWTCAERQSAVRLVVFVANCLLYDTCYVFGNAIVPMLVTVLITTSDACTIRAIVARNHWLAREVLVVWYSGNSGLIKVGRFSSALKVLIAMIYCTSWRGKPLADSKIICTRNCFGVFRVRHHRSTLKIKFLE